MASTKKNLQRVPQFASLDEEAEFWQTHSPLDYPDDFVEDPDFTVERPLRHNLMVTLDAKTIDRLAAIARAQGIAGPSSLAAAWLRERLEQAEKQEVKADW